MKKTQKIPYSMVIQWSDEDQVYVVTLPEFGGCRTHGSTYEKAAKSGREVLEMLMEPCPEDSKPLPEPATLEQSEEFWKGLKETQRSATATSRTSV